MNPHHLTARTLDRFVLLSLLGEGGMGEVWAARDTGAAGVRIVALKTTKQLGADAKQVLFDEARIASLIQHPNVCRVYELGEADDTQYLVMEWSDGASLQDLVMATPGQALPPPLAVRIVAGVAAGLHAAHELVDDAGQSLGVVHRDVSPQNVLISTGGVVTVTDFGIAKAHGQTHRPTETGEVKGKLSYMAPEQVRSRDVDRRADIFALGCVLYMATLGKRPFGGGDALTTMYQILESEIEAPRSIDPNFPPSLEPILLRALAKDRDERFQTCEEFQLALEGWLQEVGERVSQKEVGAALTAALGLRLIERNTKIRDRSTQTAAEIEAARAAEERPGTAGAVTGASSTTATVELNSETLLPKASRGRILALSGAALSVVVGLGVLLMWRSAPRPPTDTAADVARPPTDAKIEEAKQTGAEAPRPVTLRVRVTPANAVLHLDGVEIGAGLVERREPRSAVKHQLTARLAGFSESSRTIVFDSDQDLFIELAPEPTKSAIGRKGKPTTTAKPAPAPSSAWGKPVGTSTKPPRSLDSSNPFAKDK